MFEPCFFCVVFFEGQNKGMDGKKRTMGRETDENLRKREKKGAQIDVRHGRKKQILPRALMLAAPLHSAP